MRSNTLQYILELIARKSSSKMQSFEGPLPPRSGSWWR